MARQKITYEVLLERASARTMKAFSTASQLYDGLPKDNYKSDPLVPKETFIHYFLNAADVELEEHRKRTTLTDTSSLVTMLLLSLNTGLMIYMMLAIQRMA